MAGEPVLLWRLGRSGPPGPGGATSGPLTQLDLGLLLGWKGSRSNFPLLRGLVQLKKQQTKRQVQNMQNQQTLVVVFISTIKRF